MRFYTNGLLSKWGFDDGDQLSYWLEELGIDRGNDYNRREVLIAVVRRFVLPQIKQVVEVYEIGSIHNPIRASTVDGHEIDCHADNEHIRLDPEYVDVPDKELGSFIRSLSVAGKPQ